MFIRQAAVLLALLAVLSGCGGSATGPSANGGAGAAAATSATNVLTFTSQSGDYVGGGQTVTLEGSGALSAAVTCSGNSLIAVGVSPTGT